MGGVLSYLLVLGLLTHAEGSWVLPKGIYLQLAVFGSPRVGNAALAELYRDAVLKYRNDHGLTKFKEYSVKGYNDGVPTLPPRILGFSHFTPTPLYLYHGFLYHVPLSECEHSLFTVKHDSDEYSLRPPDYPLGGHNYYNGRDMEKCIRRMRWLDIMVSGERDWESRYLNRLAEEQTRILKRPSYVTSISRGFWNPW